MFKAMSIIYIQSFRDRIFFEHFFNKYVIPSRLKKKIRRIQIFIKWKELKNN